MENITIGDIAGWLALFAGIITSAGVIYKFAAGAASRSIQATINKALEPVINQQTAVNAKVDALSTELHQNNLQTARVDLMQAIQHAPHEHQSILQLGEHYFLELKGDVWMSGIFQQWAKQEGVDISYIVNATPHLKN